jgi:site-specific recombinase XerD
VDGFLGKQEIRASLKLRDWEKAQARIREWEAEGKATAQEHAEPVTVHKAWEQFLSDCEARNLREPTLKKYRHLQRQAEEFGEQHGLRSIEEFNLEMLLTFRASWPNANLSALKKLELLRTFYRFALENGWVLENWAKKIRNPKVDPHVTMPLSPDEIIRTLRACDELEGISPLERLRLRALIRLLRYSSLRISDAVTLPRERVKGDRLFLYTAKTGVPVQLPLPKFVIEALDAVSAGGRHFFWTGRSKPKTPISHWQDLLKRVFEKAEIERGHAHRLRDTFAVELLLRGVPLERVSVLLGHRSIKVTERHDAPWVSARQEQLEADIKQSWSADPVAFAETKGTSEVHEKQQRVN